MGEHVKCFAEYLDSLENSVFGKCYISLVEFSTDAENLIINYYFQKMSGSSAFSMLCVCSQKVETVLL